MSALTAKRRVYISMPGDLWLDQKQNEIKWGIVAEIEKAGYEAQVFVGPRGGQGLPAGRGWTLADCKDVMRRCVGAAIIGFPKWHFTRDGKNVQLATESNHHEGAVAHTYGLPLLTIAEEHLERRLIFNPSAGLEIVFVPAHSDASWLSTTAFQGPFANWRQRLDRRRDVFLGYCSSSDGPASNLKRFLEQELGLTVLDWQIDFAPGGSVLQQIEEAAARCSAGIFLFTKDDNITDEGEVGTAVPRGQCRLRGRLLLACEGQGPRPDHPRRRREDARRPRRRYICTAQRQDQPLFCGTVRTTVRRGAAVGSASKNTAVQVW